jgi:predicted dehydrogenase
MSRDDKVRVAFIGAGGICEQRHLPNLSSFPEVELITVCNRSPESSRQIAEKWKFRRTSDDWRQVVADSEVDVIFIGTWPYAHREMSIAALVAGKHVFCQARMCMDWHEAMQMVAAAASHPRLVNMVCPPPHRVRWERPVKQLLSRRVLGELHSVVALSTCAANCDANSATWRERIELSGLNILQVGIFAETMNSWCGEYESLAATNRILIPEKRDTQGNRVEIQIPQIVSIVGCLENGTHAAEYHSGLAVGYERSQVVLFGSNSTCTVDLLAQQMWLHKDLAKPDQGELIKDAGDEWRVERQFVDAVLAARRGESWHVSPDFVEASHYMRKLQAIHDSAAQSRTVQLADYSAETELRSWLA